MRSTLILSLLLLNVFTSVYAQTTTLNCFTIDWETDLAGTFLTEGTIINSQYGSLFTVTGHGRTEAAVPRIYDSAHPTSSDPDLGTPNNACGGPGVAAGTNHAGPGGSGENCQALGNILILSKFPPSGPNDVQKGGQLSFLFNQDVQVDRIGLLDIDLTETTGSVKLFSNTSALLFTGHQQPLGDNTFQYLSLGNTTGVRSLVVDLAGSGAVTSLEFCVPEEQFPSPCPDGELFSAPTACLDDGADPQVRHHTEGTSIVLRFLESSSQSSADGCNDD